MANTLRRQNTLFVSEDWLRVYEAIQNVDFRAYDFENYIQAIFNYLRVNYPEEFNDWIASSEFVMKVDILAWLSQNISFRIDLNTRENFLATAERRDSLIRLAQNVAYKVDRATGASGQVKINRVRTNQPLTDSNGIQLQNREIIWNDPRNEDWFEQFIIVMNSALSSRTQFGRPLSRFSESQQVIEQYVLNSSAPVSGSYSISASVNSIDMPFDVINSRLNTEDGVFEELAPNSENVLNIFYETDGAGLSSVGTGFFFPIKQGTLGFIEQEYVQPIIIRTQDIEVQNINNDDFFVQEVDQNGNVIVDWTKVDNVFGEGVAFNTLSGDQLNIYEVDTLNNDQVRVRFGDGTFGNIPQGRYRFWYRTSNPNPQIVKPDVIQNKQITIPYVANQEVYFLTITFSLQEQLVNAAASESNFDIRTRANRVFYSQNRMITGQDYNSFFLRDTAITKVKTVNRTFAGHSRYTRLTDPTGLYDNLKVVGEDGRYYRENTIAVQFESGDENILPVRDLMNNTLKPILRKADKSLLYITLYPRVDLTNLTLLPVNSCGCSPNVVGLSSPDKLKWQEFEVVAGQSRGNIKLPSGTIKPVGFGNASDCLKYIDTDSVVVTGEGVIAYVDRIVDDGTPLPGIILRDEIPDEADIVSAFPAFRSELNGNELFDIETQLIAKADFGLRWDQCAETSDGIGAWRIVTLDNIDKDSEFSLDNQGDTTQMNLDASWLVLFEYIPGGAEEDQWKITDRGVGQFFESANEVDFFFAEVDAVVNQETGQVQTDNVALLDTNETRDSGRRRGPFVDNAGISVSTTVNPGFTRFTFASETAIDQIFSIDECIVTTGFEPGNNGRYVVTGVSDVYVEVNTVPSHMTEGAAPGGAEPKSINGETAFLEIDIPLFVADVLRHDDGYVNPNGLFVTPADEDRSGFFDNPFLFTDLVLTNGSDLVMWRRIEEQGFNVWEPIGLTTIPYATYGPNGPYFGDTVDLVTYSEGDIHLDTSGFSSGGTKGIVNPDNSTWQWLIADVDDSGQWIAAPDQDDYKWAIGRSDLQFLWTHFSADKFRIDPSLSNVMDVYILTSTYDENYRIWLANNGTPDEEPDAPTPESLRIQFAGFDDFKAISDSIIYHGARYLPLFGRQAIDELQATFKLVRTPGSQVSEKDIRLQCLAAIDEYFGVDNWDYGETFYFTELAAFIHGRLAPDIQSVVIVPKSDNQAFGRLFQVRSEPDQLFVSAASPEDVEIVDSLTDEELRIGTLS